MSKNEQHLISKEDLLKGIEFEIKNTKDINEAAEVALDNLSQSPDYYNKVSPTDELVDMNKEDILQDTEPDDAYLWAVEPEEVSEDIINTISPAQLKKSVYFVENTSDYTEFTKEILHRHYTIIKRNIKKAINYSQDELSFYEKLMELKHYLNSIGLNEDGTSLYMADDGVVENEMPTGVFNVDDLKNIRSYKGRIFYLKNKLQLLGQGSSRMVFKIDNQKVIKLAKNAKGIGQNFLEAELGQDNFFTEVVAKVYDYDPDSVWLISEFADKFNDAEFKKIEGYDFRTLGVYLTSEKYGHKWEQGVSPEEYDAFIYSTSPNSLATNVEQLMRDYNMPVGDLVVKSSYGISTRNGERAVILIDYGYDDNVYKTYYSKIKEFVIKEMEMYSKEQQPVNERIISAMPDSSTVEVKQNCRLAGNADGTSDACNQGDINNLNLKKINENFDEAAYRKWKRDNVSYRGIADNATIEDGNGGMAMLGQGLYSVPASNKSMARKYGKLHILVNAIPKKPKVFKTLNEWEIWFQYNVVLPKSKAKGKDYPDARDVNSITDEMLKLGYDGVIIKGREIVNYKPENVRYYTNDRQLEMYYEDNVAPNNSIKEVVDVNLPSGDLDGFKSYDITNDGILVGQIELADRSNDYIILDRIFIDKEHRGNGYADEALKAVLRYADKNSKIVTLTPDSTWGSNKERLKRWYQSHGFVMNKGKGKDFQTMQLMYRKPSTINEVDNQENTMRKSVLTNFLNTLEEYQSNHYGNIDRNDIVRAWNRLNPRVKQYIQPSPQEIQKLYRGADGISPKKAISFTNNKSFAGFYGTYVLPFTELESYDGLISTEKVVKLVDGFKLNFDVGDDEGEVIVLNPKWKNFNIEKYRQKEMAEDLEYNHVTDATQDSYKIGIEESEQFDVYREDNDPSNDSYFKYKDTLGGEAYGKLTGNVGKIISMNSVPFGMRYSPNAGDFKKRGFFTNLIKKLKEHGVVSLSIRLQSEETIKAVKRLLEKGILTNPRNYHGLSDAEYPTLFDIALSNSSNMNEAMSISDINELPFKQEIESLGGKLYSVGGAVRDKFLGKESKDLDVLVTGVSFDQLEELLSKYGRVDAVGKSFGILKFKPKGSTEEIDIAIPRTERATGEGGHKGFEVSSDHELPIEKDLERRDFTINAIAKDSSGQIIDPYGGQEDLKNKIIRIVNPEAFSDDPLRMLRAIQFAARFGFTIEPNTEQLIKTNASRIKEIPAERILTELDKIVKKGDVLYGADLLRETGLYEQIFGSKSPIGSENHWDLDAWNNVKTMGEYIYLLTSPVQQNPAEFYKKVLKGDIPTYKEISALQTGFKNVSDDSIVNRAIAHNMYTIAPESLNSGILPQQLQVAAQELNSGKYPKGFKDLAITGNDLINKGLSGKELGDTLKKLLTLIYSNKIRNDKNDLLNYVDGLI